MAATTSDHHKGGRVSASDGGGGGPGGGDDDPAGFLRQLEMAKALSLETLELERIQRQRKTSDGQLQVSSHDRTRTEESIHTLVSSLPKRRSCVIDRAKPKEAMLTKPLALVTPAAVRSPQPDPRGRPRPGPSRQNSGTAITQSLPPPPRRQGSIPGTATTPPVGSNDLITFLSPDTSTDKPKSRSDCDLVTLLDIAFDDSFGQDRRASPAPSASIAAAFPASSESTQATPVGTILAPSLPGPLPLSQWNFPSPCHYSPAFAVGSTTVLGPQTIRSTTPIYATPAGFVGPSPTLMPARYVVPPVGMAPVSALFPPSAVFGGGRLSPATVPPAPAPSAVLRAIEKKSNGNLIDLSFFGSPVKTGGSGSNFDCEDLLQSFDPLLKRDSARPVAVGSDSSNPSFPQDVQGSSGDPIRKRGNRASGAYYNLWESESAPFVPERPPADGSPAAFDIADSAEESESPTKGDGEAPPVPLRGHSSLGSTPAVPEVQLREHHRSVADRAVSYRQRCSRIYESIRVMSDLKGSSAEIQCYRDSLVRLRREFMHDNYHTNPGLVISPTMESLHGESSSVRLSVYVPFVDSDAPVQLTCDVTTSIEHVISQIVCSEMDDASNVNLENYVLKVHGMEEYFAADSALVDYEYVHHCQKFDEPVKLSLVDADKLTRELARTARDDERDVNIEVADLLPPSSPSVCHKTLSILTETLDREVSRIKKEADEGKATSLQSKGVTQAVKAICATLGQVETREVREAVEGLMQTELWFSKPCVDRIVQPEVEAAMLADATKRPIIRLTQELPATPRARIEVLHLALERINDAIHNLLEMYCRCFFVHFSVPTVEQNTHSSKNVITYMDSFLVNIGSVHRIPPQWATSFDHFVVSCELYHGSRQLTERVETRPVQVTTSFYQQLAFDEWLELNEVLLCVLPREARLCCTLYGVRPTSAESRQQAAIAVDSVGPDMRESLGWATLQLFDYNGLLCQGSSVCGMWAEEVDKRLGPAISNTQDNHCPVMQVNLPDFGCAILFPPVLQDSPKQKHQNMKRDFETLTNKFQQKLIDIVESTSSSSNIMEDRELIWDRRHYLYDIPQALPKVLMAAHSWDWSCLADLYLMLKNWKPLCAVDAMELLLPCFPDIEVRKTAISWIKNMSSDELCDFLPEMVQALKYETYEDSPTARFLLERSLTSIRIMHHLYWLLKQNLDDTRCGRRILLLLNSLKAIAGASMRSRLEHQEALMSSLAEVAAKIKTTKDSLRQKVLLHELEATSALLEETPTCLPLNPSVEVREINFEACHYFTSKTVPLKISFKNKSSEPRVRCIEAIFKDGDDLRQDMLTLQLIRIMDKLWLKEGLDLRIVTFGCIPTDLNKGIVEMVEGAETLRSIQSVHGVTGPFKDHLIAEWLQKQNPSEQKYAQAVENFTYSCAGYSVATYVLGICDRHNDNIMIKTSGHIFHIDFGKFLGDCQMFGSIKRDRVPFVLTSDMAYVINGDGKPSSRFQYFVETCCKAFNVVRKNGNLFLNLLAMMASAGIPGVTTEAVGYVQQALLLNCSDAQASVRFTRLIEESLKAWFTQFNFFIHSLVQLFSSEQNNDGVLSFVPRTYSLETDGKISGVQVVGYQKRYDPEKNYVYILRVERESGRTCLFRSYPEFCEFQQKLCARFPLAKYRSLPRVYLGRSNIRQVAEKRRVEIDNFLTTLYKMADEIKHCDLVYTFFHPVLRDQQEDSQMWSRMKVDGPKQRSIDAPGCVTGHVKLSIHHKSGILFVMVMHARNLSENKGVAPDPFVKTYLVPDPNKNTKRKTKVVRRNSHPTFMEMLQYQFPLEVVRQKLLQVTVWNSGLVAENGFLGAVEIKLSELNLAKESQAWYALDNLNHLMQK